MLGNARSEADRNIVDIINYTGAGVTLAMGLLGLVSPGTAAKITSIRPVGKLGVSEIRATYGGLFAAMGLFALFAGTRPVFQVVGVAWVGAALGRTVSMAIDRNPSGKNAGAVIFEAVVGVALLL